MKRQDEFREQVAAIAVLDQLAEDYQDRRFLWVHHSPNGGARSAREGARMKQAGTRRGFPDLVLPVPSKGMRGLAIELKAGKGTTTPEQRAWIEAFVSWGWDAGVCLCAGEVVRAVVDHLDHTMTRAEAQRLENRVVLAGGTWNIEPKPSRGAR